MSSNCGKCMEPITAVPDSVKCFGGNCLTTFHQRCLTLTRTLSALLTSATNKNIVVVCDGCLSKLGHATNHETISVANDLSAIKTSLETLTAAIVKPNVAWPSISSKPKRSRLESEIDETPSLPVTHQPINIVGSLETTELQVVEPRRLLVASMLHPSTDPNALSDFLKAKLGSDCDIRVSKLVPAGRDISQLDFVSFKVAIQASSYDALLSPVIWPKGVTVRPFENRPKRPRRIGHFLPMMNQLNPQLVQMD